MDGTGERLIGTGIDTFNTYAWPHFSLDDSEIVFDRNNEIDAIRISNDSSATWSRTGRPS